MAKKKKNSKTSKKPGYAKMGKAETKARRSRGISLKLAALILFAGLLLLFLFRGPITKLFEGTATTASVDRKAFPKYSESSTDKKVNFSDFLGSEACAGCHSKEYELWKNSTHGRAGGPPRPDVVIGDFDGQNHSFKDGRVQPRIVNGRYVFNLQVDGFGNQSYTVDAVVGGGHMVGGGTQTYFSEFPDGTLRFLPFDYIRAEGLWFGETNQGKGWIPITENLSVHELSEWPPSRILGAHLSIDNCQQCHGSQIQVTYNPEEKKYDTHYTSLDINCESCHGPGKKHVELMNSGSPDTLKDIGMASLAILGKDASLEVCFQCHALKDVLDPDYLPGEDLEEHFALKFPVLGENPYHADGRIRAFGYQQNHLFSDCYLSGSMTCVDCHDPHSQNYRDITGKVLHDRLDDEQCTSCHASKMIDIQKHTYHLPGSDGSKCVSCHMPYLQHQAMGETLRFARSDHTIPIPRPAYDEAMGIENACSKCHPDKSVGWRDAKTKEWWGELKPHKAIIDKIEKSKQETLDRKSAGMLLLNGSTVHHVGQMAGLSHFAKNYLYPDMAMLEPEIIESIKQFCESPDLDVKSMALASLHLAQDQNPEVHNFLAAQLEDLQESEKAVRKRWATALPYFAKQYEEKGDFQNALKTYEKALEIEPDNTAVLINMGYTYQLTGNNDEAIRTYLEALKIDPYDAMGWVNLGNAYQKTGDETTALAIYQKAIEMNPWNPVALYNIGNHYYRNEEIKPAISAYQKAVALDPSLALAYFNLTKAYIKTQAFAEALSAVRAGLQFDPDNETGKQMLQELERAFSGG